MKTIANEIPTQKQNKEKSHRASCSGKKYTYRTSPATPLSLYMLLKTISAQGNLMGVLPII